MLADSFLFWTGQRASKAATRGRGSGGEATKGDCRPRGSRAGEESTMDAAGGSLRKQSPGVCTSSICSLFISLAPDSVHVYGGQLIAPYLEVSNIGYRMGFVFMYVSRLMQRSF